MYEPEPSPAADVLRLVNEAPRCFFLLSAMAEHVYAELGVGGPERGVLRDLFLEGAQSVPEIARRRPRTRQAVQQVVARLLEKGLVEVAQNPRHRRSKLFVLTKKGIALCVEMQERDLDEIRRIAARRGFGDAAAAADVLARLNAALAEELAAREAAPM
ncbi:MAG: MarR family transcriptional regulator, partial [Parvularculaceae bacterium]|nr:MarR family transcriptional regulator [Parvularculaceae bacterium]